MTADMVGGPLGEHLADRIPRAAQAGHKRFPCVPAADFEQVMWERVLRDPAKFRKLLADGREGIIWKELSRAATKLGNEDDRYRRAVKAMAAGTQPGVPGYHVADEEFYSKGMLEHILPVLIEAEFNPANAIERATNGTDAAGVRIQTSESGTAAETYMAILIDVTQAFGKLNSYHQNLLKRYYGISQEDTSQGRWERESEASSMGMTLKALQGKVYRAVSLLQVLLGGSSPWTNHRNGHGTGE